ncbi:MAG: hypothetical protein ABR499_04085 [Gemmatimonadaceae bacterium]
MRDLADHKRMSLSACLEEILLHTSEPFGDGVASPHTKSQLALIQDLKKRQGIEYDDRDGYALQCTTTEPRYSPPTAT